MAENNADQYIMGAHEAEVKRLTLQHEVMTESTGKLVFSPVDLSSASGLKVLDSATADGKWLVDLRDSLNQGHDYYGTDITDAMFPKPSPDGIALSLQDITAQWPEEWKGTFDYVHQRLGLAGIGQHPLKDIVQRQCELLKPGGWIEFVELDIAPNSNPAVEKLFSLVRQMIDIIGNGWNYVSTLKGALEAAGLEAVEDKSIEVLLGASAKSSALKEKSIKSMQLSTSAFVDVVDKLPLSLNRTQVEALIAEIGKSLGEQGGAYTLRAVYGRKPTSGNPYAAPPFAPKQARKPDANLYSSLVKNTTLDVASHAFDLLGPVDPGAVVHDNGCGCLEATRALLSKTWGKDITIEATDVDPAMLERAREIAQSEKWSNVHVSSVPAEQLSFPDGHFSQSISNILIFMTRNDGLDSAKEIFRTLKPGGRAAVTTWATMPHGKAVDEVHHALRGDDAEIMFAMPERWWTASHLESVMRQGGFDKTEVKTCEVELRIEEGELRAQAEMIWSLRGIPKGGWTSADEENWDKAIDLLVERMRAISHDRSAGGAVFKMVANVAICTK